MHTHYIIGIDEAGRGAWAGPIVAGGFMIQRERFFTLGDTLPGIRDSKKLSKKEREDIYSTVEYLTHKNECQYAFSYRDADVIDAIGIREANRSCMEDIILSFLQYIDDDDTVEIWIDGCDNYQFSVDDFEYFFAKKKARKSKWGANALGNEVSEIDDKQYEGLGGKSCLRQMTISYNGGAEQTSSFLPKTFDTFGYKSMAEYMRERAGSSFVTEMLSAGQSRFFLPSEGQKEEYHKKRAIAFLINGDNLHPAISLGGIIAKVIRDRMMCEYSEDFPLYSFDSHVGYGTRKHQEEMYNYNITPIHRKSYAPVKRLISTTSSI